MGFSLELCPIFGTHSINDQGSQYVAGVNENDDNGKKFRDSVPLRPDETHFIIFPEYSNFAFDRSTLLMRISYCTLFLHCSYLLEKGFVSSSRSSIFEKR
jgi:hypothetical protein